MFTIAKDVPAPTREADIPDYGIPFGSMVKGDSVAIPYDKVPEKHARSLAQRHSRQNKVRVITQSVKAENGDVIGLRVWIGDAITDAEAATATTQDLPESGKKAKKTA